MNNSCKMVGTRQVKMVDSDKPERRIKSREVLQGKIAMISINLVYQTNSLPALVF